MNIPTFPVRRCLVLAVAGIWLALSPATHPSWSQDRPPDNATAARIGTGVERVREGKLLDAVEQFQRVLDTAGDELVPVDGRHHAPARWVIHGHFSRLPADGIRLYRQRVDGQAIKRLEEAKKRRDDDALRQLLADMFVSQPCENAILELARRAFERGEFDAAEHFWRMLLPGPSDDGQLLHFPDAKTDPAAIRARLILVKLFRGERTGAAADLKSLAQNHAAATGLLAGRTGRYVETLTALFDDPSQTTLAPVPDGPGWPTFAGSMTREGTTRARLPYFWPDVPAWRTPLPFVRGARSDSVRADALHPRALAFHPVISGGRAYIADGTRVLSIDLMTGRTATALWHNAGEEARLPIGRDVRFTLTESDGILYARFGPAALQANEPGNNAGSFLVALGPRKDEGEIREILWKLDPPSAADATTHFEGAPVIHQGRLYVGTWRQAGGEPTAGIACYRLYDRESAPELTWFRTIGKAGSEPNGETRYRHQLVTISGPNVLSCTDGGTIAALDARTGRPAWEYRYPPSTRPDRPRVRDLCPPLADGGRVYAAPADADRLLCLDAYTGSLIWEREGVEVIHLLGVAKGRLIATFGGQMKGIRGLNLRTGADSGDDGWTIHDDGGEATFGRGLVSEQTVVWPTRHGLRFLDPADGTQLRSPIPGPPSRLTGGLEPPSRFPAPFGNLTYADGVLLVTTATEVWGYVSEANKVGERKKAVEADPENPIRNADWTQSLIDAGRHAEAEEAVAKAGDARNRLRWLLAEKLIQTGDRAGARRLYGELSNGDDSFAAAAAARLAEMLTDPDQANAAWQAVSSRRGTLRDESGIPWPARIFAERRSPRPVVERRTGVRDDELNERIGAERNPNALPGCVRIAAADLDDPALRILQSSDHGIVSTGERLRMFPAGTARPLMSTLEAASPSGSWILTTGPERLLYFPPAEQKIDLEVDLRDDGPVLSRHDRVVLPGASRMAARPDDGHDDAAIRQVDGVQFINEEVAYVSSGRAIVRLSPKSGQVYRLPEGSTAELRPTYTVDGWFTLAQSTDGRMLVWAARGGPPRSFPGTRKPWREPPAAIERDRYLIPDDGSVFLFDARAGKELARYELPGTASLTGELPRFRIHQGNVLLLIDRNHGVELDQLTIDGLKRTWDRSPILIGRELDDVAIAEERIFTAADGSLRAIDWKTGKFLWEAPLPDAADTRWRIAIRHQSLFAYPAEAQILHPEFDAVGEFRRAASSRDGLLRVLSRSYDAWTARELPLLVFALADGQLVERLTFPAAGPAAGVAITSKGVVVVTGKGSWTLEPPRR